MVEKNLPGGKGRMGTPQKEYMPHCAVESKSRHSGNITVDFKVLGMYLLSVSE